MSTNRSRDLVALGAALSAFAGCGDAQTSEETLSSNMAALVSTGVTENPAAQSADWPSAGHDWSHSGHNPAETAISPSSVAGLTVKWQHTFAPAPDQFVPVIAATVAAQGVAYIADMAGFVHARNLEDGSPLWTSYASQAAPDPVFSAVIQSGPVVTDDALYVGDSAATLHKLSRTTGAVQWSKRVDENPEALIQGDLATFGPYLVFGVSSFENATVPAGDLTMRGSVATLDLDDGSLGWQTFTTSDQNLPSPKFGAGVGVWSSPAIDPRTGRVYIGTGQFYEAGSENPSKPSKKDKDLSDSLLSLSLCDGKVQAKRQFTEGDIFGLQNPYGADADVGIPPNLFEIPACHGHGRIEAVGVGDKEGTYYVMDRKNLNILWSKRIANGSVLGGFQSTAAYADGVIYVAAHERIDGTSLQTAIPPGQSATFLGTPEGFNTVQKGSRTNVFALDAATGDVIWEQTTYGAITFAPLVLANGVLFQGDVNGAIRGFDAETGAILWQTQLGGFPDGQGGFVVGNMITGLSLSRGRLMVSSLPLVPTSPSGVVAYGVP